MNIRTLLLVVLACVLTLSACSSDDDEADGVGKASEDASTEESGDQIVADSSTEPTAAPQPEQSVPALLDVNEEDITVGGYVFESDGVYLLCESASDDDPPTCQGETLQISNGDVIDPTIFLGEPGSRYSDAEVVVTGDVADGVLTIG